MEQCNRHIEIVEQLDELEERVHDLELADTETKTELKNLIKQVEKLVITIELFMSNTRKLIIGASKAVFGISGTIILILLGFFIWYIQKL